MADRASDYVPLDQRVGETLNEMMERRALERLHGERCAEQGHQWESGVTPDFRLVETCKWCHAGRWFASSP